MQNQKISDSQIQLYIEQVFANYDRNNSGTLEADELAAFLNDVYRLMGIAQHVSVRDAQQILGRIDRDHNGRVSREELFLAFRNQLVTNGQYSISDPRLPTQTPPNIYLQTIPNQPVIQPPYPYPQMMVQNIPTQNMMGVPGYQPIPIGMNMNVGGQAVGVNPNGQNFYVEYPAQQQYPMGGYAGYGYQTQVTNSQFTQFYQR